MRDLLTSYSYIYTTDHSAEVDPEVLNQKYFARTEELWDSIESSRWWKDD